MPSYWVISFPWAGLGEVSSHCQPGFRVACALCPRPLRWRSELWDTGRQLGRQSCYSGLWPAVPVMTPLFALTLQMMAIDVRFV